MMVRIQFIIIVFCFLLPNHANALNNTTSLYRVIPQLQVLKGSLPRSKGPNSFFNSTLCCLQAIHDGIAHGPDDNFSTNGTYLLLNNSEGYYPNSSNSKNIFLGNSNNSNITKFVDDIQKSGGFPCGSGYEHNAHAPTITITASYCLNTCGRGWQRASTRDTSQWISPFFGFIIPAVVFCLSIPRRRKLEIPNALFYARLTDPFAWILVTPKLVIAAILVGSDTLIWLSICFAYSGPMLLSAVYEAWLDNRLMYFFDSSAARDLTAQMKSLLLFVVLVGNLDLNIDDDESRKKAPTGQLQAAISAELEPEHANQVTIQWEGRASQDGHSTGTSTHNEAEITLQVLRARSLTLDPENPLSEAHRNTEDHSGLHPDEEESVGFSSTNISIPLSSQDPIQDIIRDLRINLGDSAENESGDVSTANPASIVNLKLQELEDLVKKLRRQALNADIIETDEPGFIKTTTNSPLNHIEQLIYDLRLYGPQGHCNIRGFGTQPDQLRPCFHACQWRPANCEKSKASKTPRYIQCLARVETRLRTMLACQYSFGSTVGSPIVFFVGAFVFTLVTELVDLGDKTTALNLSFGMWWMTIPHIAIMSGLLLAGNNPNTLEGVVAHETIHNDASIEFYDIVSNLIIHLELATPEWFERKTRNGKSNLFVRFLKHPVFKWFSIQLAYPSRYKTQWLWHRGANKKHWIDAVVGNYLISEAEIPENNRVSEDEFEDGNIEPSEYKIAHMDPAILALQKRMHASTGDWFRIFFIAIFLILVPFALSFLTSYETPTVGLSCRSLTFTVYLVTQVFQMLVHFYDFRKHSHKSSVFWRHLRHVLSIFLAIVAVFSAIGGTVMQLAGVYNNCICDTSIGWWLDLNNPRATLEIGTNSHYEISQANRYWVPGAGTAVSFLGTVCYIGWWYQRRLRDKFRLAAGHLSRGVRVE